MDYLRTLAFLVLPMSMFAQAELSVTSASDGNFLVAYAAHLDRGDGVVNVINTGASAGSNVPLLGQNSYGDICINVYVFAPDQEMATCCVCPTRPNALHS